MKKIAYLALSCGLLFEGAQCARPAQQSQTLNRYELQAQNETLRGQLTQSRQQTSQAQIHGANASLRSHGLTAERDAYRTAHADFADALGTSYSMTKVVDAARAAASAIEAMCRDLGESDDVSLLAKLKMYKAISSTLGGIISDNQGLFNDISEIESRLRTIMPNMHPQTRTMVEDELSRPVSAIPTPPPAPRTRQAAAARQFDSTKWENNRYRVDGLTPDGMQSKLRQTTQGAQYKANEAGRNAALNARQASMEPQSAAGTRGSGAYGSSHWIAPTTVRGAGAAGQQGSSYGYAYD